MIRFPTALEQELARRLLRRLRVATTLRRERPDVPAANLLAAFESALPLDARSLVSTAVAVESFTTRSVLRALRDLTGTDHSTDRRLAGQALALSTLHQAWAQGTAQRVKGLEARVLSGEAGDARAWARLLARDEVGTLAGRVSRLRQEGLGFERYRWTSSGDEYVRSEHRRRCGSICAWSDNGDDHPGHSRGCRCTAQPVL